MLRILLLSATALLSTNIPAIAGEDLATGFAKPPQATRPWVYWFWLNSNITKQGITADLEAMKRVGVGGVLIMEVDQGAPVGPVSFMSDRWREMFGFAVAEAGRLGIEINMNDDAGWNGSGGPWIKPEQAMQELAWSETAAQGPKQLDAALPRPAAVAGFYRDIAVIAVPDVGEGRIPDFEAKAAYQRRTPAKPGAGSPVVAIKPDQVLDISSRMTPEGRLAWDVPAGKWTILRIGHTCTGAENAPAPKSGRGLECDKLSEAGIQAQFDGMMAKLAKDSGPAVGKALVASHIDSWENGSQNWTAKMREEFRNRRGYDLFPFLPVMTGRVVGSAEISDRFLWDLRKTVSDLVIEKYAGGFSKLAREAGLKFTAEAYGSPCDYIPYAARADEPMGEFWVGGAAIESCRTMASAGHVYGKPIIGAEAFTADNNERWQQHPASVKALGDRAFCEGINRFVFHRYALQPWKDVKPGMSMGPWGLHYERTTTWWDWTEPWHDYLARCQYLLRQGTYVADIAYLQAETPPQGFAQHPVNGYNYDDCTADAVIGRMSVCDGRIAVEGGMSYRLLVLPDSPTMTPALLAKIKALVEAGATVLGPRPQRSPSLSGHPACDAEIKVLADALWGNSPATLKGDRNVGKGRVAWGVTPEQFLVASGVKPDFDGPAGARFIHRATEDADVYFVSTPWPSATRSTFTFRVAGRQPELWRPDTGRIEPATVFAETGDLTNVAIPLDPSGSVFVVFRKGAKPLAQLTAVKLGAESVLDLSPQGIGKITVLSASYGVPGDAARTRDVKAKLQAIADAGKSSFQVAELAAGDDPALNVVKTLNAEFSVGNRRVSLKGTDPQTLDLASPQPAEAIADLCRDAEGRLVLDAWKPGRYEIRGTSGEPRSVEVPALPSPLPVAGPWTVAFPPGLGAPARTTINPLASLSVNPDPGVAHFSGTASYTRTLDVPSERLEGGKRLFLDLGRVDVMARVVLNGKDFGIVWKPPYVVDITEAARPGINALEVRVVNRWINRQIGDEALPEDSVRNPDGTCKEWPAWLLEGKPSPAGRVSFTSWRLWKKGEPLAESGLVGPVVLRSVERVIVP
ncbi:glycosyl hydrolase [Aquisphaera insulae]|uniref:glycosyl hydrolase n=1 Tax=Aquisphaera insulae TaxID=2712864 RepID=UPI0013EA4958|nr:glycosyl hydrolase [Aquisphaera insulae]